MQIHRIGSVILGIVLALLRNMSYYFMDFIWSYLAYALLGAIIVFTRKWRYSGYLEAGIYVGLIGFIAPRLDLLDFFLPIGLCIPTLFTVRRYLSNRWLAVGVLLFTHTCFWLITIFAIRDDRTQEHKQFIQTTYMQSVDDGQMFFPSDSIKVKVIDLYFNACGYCRPSLRHISELREKYSNDPNVSFYAVNTHDTDQEEIKEVRRQIGFDLPILLDSTRYFIDVKGSTYMPAVLIVDKHNNLRYEYTGGYSSELEWPFELWLEDRIRELKNE